jgi:hypothetical protein
VGHEHKSRLKTIETNFAGYEPLSQTQRSCKDTSKFRSAKTRSEVIVRATRVVFVPLLLAYPLAVFAPENSALEPLRARVVGVENALYPERSQEEGTPLSVKHTIDQHRDGLAELRVSFEDRTKKL